MLLPAGGNVGSKADAAGQEARATVAQAVKPAEPRFISALAHLIFHASFQLPGNYRSSESSLGSRRLSCSSLDQAKLILFCGGRCSQRAPGVETMPHVPPLAFAGG